MFKLHNICNMRFYPSCAMRRCRRYMKYSILFDICLDNQPTASSQLNGKCFWGGLLGFEQSHWKSCRIITPNMRAHDYQMTYACIFVQISGSIKSSNSFSMNVFNDLDPESMRLFQFIVPSIRSYWTTNVLYSTRGCTFIGFWFSIMIPYEFGWSRIRPCSCWHLCELAVENVGLIHFTWDPRWIQKNLYDPKKHVIYDNSA